MAIGKLNKRRATAGIAAATLLTMSLISGTLAKYTSTGNSWDKARVAKWGIEITTTNDLFSDAYLKKDGGANENQKGKWTLIDDGDKLTVKAETQGVDILAPGTKNIVGTNLAIGGTSEVDAQITLEGLSGKDIYMNAPAGDHFYQRAVKDTSFVNGDTIGADDVWAVEKGTTNAMPAKGETVDIGKYDYYRADADAKIEQKDFTTTGTVETGGTNVVNYYPVMFFLNKDETAMVKNNKTTLANLFGFSKIESSKGDIQKALELKNKFEAGEKIDVPATKITWKWNFRQMVDNTEITNETATDQHDMDKVDTMFGELALGSDDVIYISGTAAGGSVITTNSDGFIFADGAQFGCLQVGFNAAIHAVQID